MATISYPKPDARVLRGSILGALCLVALPAGGAMAQTVAVALDRSPGDSPMLIDEAWKAPGNIPEIIRPTTSYEDLLGSRAIADPGVRADAAERRSKDVRVRTPALSRGLTAVR